MTKTLTLIIGTLAYLLSHGSYATTSSNEIPVSVPVPGGIAVLDLVDYKPGTTVKYNNKRAAVMTHQGRWLALGGIPLSAKAGDRHSFTVSYKNGHTNKQQIEILAKTFPEQRLTIKNKRKVNPNTDDMQRISKERIRKSKAKKHWSEPSPEFDFVWPVEGRISSTFDYDVFLMTRNVDLTVVLTLQPSRARRYAQQQAALLSKAEISSLAATWST